MHKGLDLGLSLGSDLHKLLDLDLNRTQTSYLMMLDLDF